MVVLTKLYEEAKISVKWLVVGNTDTIVRENQTLFLKIYLFNESKNRDLVVVSWDVSEIARYKIDSKSYRYEGKIWHLKVMMKCM
ncbi:hypothetical protein [Cellulosilyticum ruminicola]|uniref:hypothetical protein n=1 Tax=Cellulosilyticum ruminicola TaxID=425254 RepID=UPI0006CFA35D|nr:hypothetical protein [Cellulosilyticum ruminicola]